MTLAPRPGPRDRLLRAARDLTYTHGFAIGVDAILTAAEVARRSLYQHFGGKDGLVTEVLRSTAADTERDYQRALAAGGEDPRARLLALFDALDEQTSGAGFRGCHFISADLGLAAPDHPAHAQSRAHRRRVYELFEHELTMLGHPDPPGAAHQIQLLLEGVMVVGTTRPETHPARAARALAVHVLDAHGEC